MCDADVSIALITIPNGMVSVVPIVLCLQADTADLRKRTNSFKAVRNMKQNRLKAFLRKLPAETKVECFYSFLEHGVHEYFTNNH